MARRGATPVWRQFAPTPAPANRADQTRIAIVGAGPVGLALAIDLGQRGHDVVVLARNDFIPGGSKAICFSKRSLDILDRLGVGEAAVAKGVVWNTGKVFWRDRREPIYTFDLQPVKEQKMPAFINLQQYHLEAMLVERIAGLPNVELRWAHEATAIAQCPAGVEVTVSTPGGVYTLAAEWLVACDGSRSSVRGMLGLDFEGRVFEDNFLIADIRMTADRPAERWFWFDPPFNPGRSALLHKQPDSVWRLDFQLGPDADRDAWTQPSQVDPMIRAMLGDTVDYEPVWYSVYTFQCRRMARFVHDRVIFAGDSAHLVSPFGARGCNGGLADADNLGWKLDAILGGRAGPDLIASYDHEAGVTAEENIRQSSRSTDFMTPRGPAATAYRDAVLELSASLPFARTLVNSGRLSTAIAYPDSPLNTPDIEDWTGGSPPGAPLLDAPLGSGWLLERLSHKFTVIDASGELGSIADVERLDLHDDDDAGLALQRLGLSDGGALLIRPDQYVAARWKHPTPDLIRAALARATGGEHAADNGSEFRRSGRLLRGARRAPRRFERERE